MRTIERTTQFKRDYKRELKGRYRAELDEILLPVIKTLMQDLSLSVEYQDHQLTGNWKDHRDCHIKPDLVLIYRLPDIESLQLVRLGSHAELGL